MSIRSMALKDTLGGCLGWLALGSHTAFWGEQAGVTYPLVSVLLGTPRKCREFLGNSPSRVTKCFVGFRAPLLREMQSCPEPRVDTAPNMVPAFVRVFSVATFMSSLCLRFTTCKPKFNPNQGSGLSESPSADVSTTQSEQTLLGGLLANNIDV